MKKILLTGGAGFIGVNLVRYLLLAEPNIHIFNLDALTYAGSLENLRDLPDDTRHIFIHGNICDMELVTELIEENQIDTIIHLAAETHVDRSILGPAPFIQTNIVGTFNLLEAARVTWGEEGYKAGYRFHHVSTDEVFGSLDTDAPPFCETTPYDPRSPYSASKASSDHLVRSYFHTYGLPITITNCTNNYGPFQYPEKLIPLVIINALKKEKLPIYGDGQQVRDWLYVEDHCEAIHLVIKRGRVGETYSVGGGNQHQNIEVIKEVCTILDTLRPNNSPHASLIHHVADRPGHDRRYAMDIHRISTELGWIPRHELNSGLKKTVHWYLDNQEWVKTIQNQKKYVEWLNRNYTTREFIE